MALQKTPIPINFAKGIDTKSDPYQLQMDTFAGLQNSVFTTTGRLTKRNGYANNTSLPNALQTTLTTLNDNLVATGSNLYALSQDTNQWLNKGIIQPIGLDVLPLVRVSTSQTTADTAVAENGLVCTVYEDNSIAYYQVSDSVTGQQIVPRTACASISNVPRAFLLGNYFIVTFLATVSGSPHLQRIAIPTANPTIPVSAVDISTNVLSINAGYDGIVTNNTLFISWAGSGATVRTTFLTSALVLATGVSIASHTATLMSVTADNSGTQPLVWVSFWDSSSTNGFTTAYDPTLTTRVAVTQFITSTVINELTSLATGFKTNSSILTVFYENQNQYNSTGADPNTSKTDFITTNTVTQATVVGTSSIILRSVGLASKAFMAVNGTTYMLVTYGETNQPTYFLMDSLGNLYMRLAYSNGGGYQATQVLPTVSYQNNTYYVPYLTKDFLATTNASTPDGTGANKTTNLPAGTPVNAIYTQTGVNLAKLTINTTGQYSSEIAQALHLTGGQLWEYDGVKPVEHGFHVWPENISIVPTGTGGSIGAGTYYYQFTYEWTDNQGMLHRSAPSIPISSGAITGTTNTNTLYVPTLRLTYKTAPNPVRIVGYRWSVNQQVYYQFTSLTTPTLNNPAVDYVTFVDTALDSTILGNVILYTTGSVIEDIAAPASIHSALFNNRLFLIDAEDRNLLWFSKQVIEQTPVEMSDLLTIYVAPTTGAQGSTGPMTALGAMDDKLIIFKKDAIYYINGIGPDNTGSNSTFSDPVFITGTVGCTNPRSIVLTPGGIMFQSDKGIWILGRDLSTTYIGAQVEIYNSQIVQAAQAIPGTNQVRFVLQDKTTLMYDYYFGQWGTFTNISAISATLWQGLHTYLNAFGQVFQEAEGTYVDGSTPVLLAFTSAWINLAGLQGLERFYFLNLLGTYKSPFKLNVQLAYNYNSSAVQATIVTPNNFAAAWGGEANWGSGAGWGGSEGNVFTARVFPQNQKCQSFQVSIQEIYDPSLGVAAGEGLSISGMTLVAGTKKGYRTQSASKSFG